ncbi:MAG: dihydroneopterin triphosphate diphosphatase [Halothiobacillaceae bacterium]|nr:dihydroneopterin triphosphate diphosphatase [Halothiobacillaceae bacterium]
MAWKRPESVLVLVCTPDGQVLMLERAAQPGFWQSVTGSLEWDEGPESAAPRELFEETGLDAPVVATGVVNRYTIHPAWRARYAPASDENVEHVFLALLPEPCPVRLSPGEHTSWRWLPARQAASLAFSATNREAILRHCLPPRALKRGSMS